MFGKLDYWRIYSSVRVKAAQQLLQRGQGAAGGRLHPWVDSSSSSSQHPLQQDVAVSEQQLPSLLVCPQEDEASQADPCHPRDNTCEQARQALCPPDATESSQNIPASVAGTSLCQHNSGLHYVERCGDCSCKSTFKDSQRGNCTREKGISLNTVLL